MNGVVGEANIVLENVTLDEMVSMRDRILSLKDNRQRALTAK